MSGGKWLREAAGWALAPVSGGASLLMTDSVGKKPRQAMAKPFKAPEVPRPGATPTLDMPLVAPGASDLLGRMQRVVTAPKVNLVDPGGPMSARAQGAETRALYDALGVSNPVDTRDTMRSSMFGELERGTHRAAVEDAGRMAAAGLTGSGTDFALASGRMGGLAAGRADAEARVQSDFADRQQEFDRGRLDTAAKLAALHGDHSIARANTLNTGRLREAELGMDADRMTAANLGQLDEMDFRRRMAGYEANQLLPYQMQTSYDMAKYNADAAKRGQNMALLGNVLGAGMKAGGAAMGMG